MNLAGIPSYARVWIVGQPWRLWANQMLAIMRQEIKRNFFTPRAIPIYLLAFGPAVVLAIDAIRPPGCIGCTLDEDTTMFAVVFQFYYLRMAIFFGVMGIFTWLFRGQIVQRTLHYYFLAPLRRELLVVGKFLAGALMAVMLFGSGVLLSFISVYWHFGHSGYDYVFRGSGLSQLAAYLGITVLACLGYGAVFLTLTIVFKNPVIPGVVWLGWETFSGILPSMLQKLSVSFYLKHLCPVSAPADGILALLTVVTEPIPAWITVLGLLLLTSAVLVFACLRSRKLEISYSSEQ